MNALSNAELSSLLASGGPVAPSDLAGYAFRGISLGLPGFVDRLLWKTFAKVFVSTATGVRGFNLRIDQSQPDAYRPRRRKPRFGDFVAVADGDETVLDYGLANPSWHPLARMRDRLVRLDNDRFLGRADIAAFGRELRTPSFFTLERSIALAANEVHDVIEAV